jgi:hypothetical protein
MQLGSDAPSPNADADRCFRSRLTAWLVVTENILGVSPNRSQSAQSSRSHYPADHDWGCDAKPSRTFSAYLLTSRDKCRATFLRVSDHTFTQHARGGWGARGNNSRGEALFPMNAVRV